MRVKSGGAYPSYSDPNGLVDVSLLPEMSPGAGQSVLLRLQVVLCGIDITLCAGDAGFRRSYVFVDLNKFYRGCVLTHGHLQGLFDVLHLVCSDIVKPIRRYLGCGAEALVIVEGVSAVGVLESAMDSHPLHLRKIS